MKRAAATLLMMLAALPASARRSRPVHARPSLTSRARAPEYLDGMAQVAASYARLEQWDKAVALYDEVRALRPGDQDVLEDLIAACMKSPRCAPRRLALLREGVEKSSQPADLLETLVQELSRRGQAKAAITELRRYVRNHPDNDDARALLIDTALDQEQRAIAMPELKLHLQRNPEDLEKRVRYLEALRDENQLPELRRQLDALLRSHPDHVIGLVLRGEVRLDAGDLRGAATDLEKARGLAERDRARSLSACRAEEDTDCVAELEEGMKRVRELDEELRATRAEHARDFRDDVVWLDLANDLERESDREP